MYRIKKLLRKFLPKRLFNFYHGLIAWSAACRYGFPSRKMIVVGVTGTNGKSTTVDLIAHLLRATGHSVGFTTTVTIGVEGNIWLNRHKMTMLGRFHLQKLLRQMVAQGCRYAIIETSSEGLVQNRHWGIDYDVAVFTNLTPEHIESHGGFENYKKAKKIRCIYFRPRLYPRRSRPREG